MSRLGFLGNKIKAPISPIAPLYWISYKESWCSSRRAGRVQKDRNIGWGVALNSANYGALAGVLTAIVVSFWNPLFENRSLSITWINPFALLVGLAVGCLVSAATGKNRNEYSI